MFCHMLMFCGALSCEAGLHHSSGCLGNSYVNNDIVRHRRSYRVKCKMYGYDAISDHIEIALETWLNGRLQDYFAEY